MIEEFSNFGREEGGKERGDRGYTADGQATTAYTYQS
jgi:hypothetical protein